MMEKKELRKMIRERLRLMSEAEKREYGQIVIEQLERSLAFKTAQTVLMFWSLSDEVDTHELILRHAADKNILLPVVVGDDTEIRYFQGTDMLRTGAFNIEEPVGDAFTDYSSIDLVVVPGMAFDKDGNRLGRGKGYYDKLLKKIPAPTIAICYSCQLVESVPHEEWDVKMDKVVGFE